MKHTSRQHECIAFAQNLAKKLNKRWFNEAKVQGSDSISSEVLEKKWFVLPSEALVELGV